MQNDLLIYFNEKKFNSTIESLNSTLTYIDEVIELYEHLGVEPLKKLEFHLLLLDTENFLFQKIMKDKPAEFAGIKIDKRAFYDQFLIKPDGYTELINAIEIFKKRTLYTAKRFRDDLDVKTYLQSFFTPLDNGKFELKTGVIESQKRWSEVYVKSEKAKRAYKLAVDLKNLLNQDNLLRKMSISENKDLGNFLKDLFLPIDVSTKEVEINIDFLQRLDTRGF